MAGSAVFKSESGVLHADKCEMLRRAAERGDIYMEAYCRRGYPGKVMPPRVMPEISSVGFWDAAKPQDWGLDWHRNEGIELTFLSRGKAQFFVDDKEYMLESGDLAITRPWQRHRIGAPNIGPSRLHWIILDVGVRHPHQRWNWPSWFIMSSEDLRKLTTLLRYNEQPVWRADRMVGSCFEKISRLVERRNIGFVQTRLKLHLNELFVALFEMLDSRNMDLDAGLSSSRRTVEIFLSRLPGSLDRDWSLGMMAEGCGLGRSRFADYCRRITNMTPIDYLNQCRLDAAVRMLVERPELSITEIALACGFRSSQYFATAFHERMGHSPSVYRKLKRNAEKRGC
ncbi:MAG: AraC family transcriptional regulator [Verrucomicrobia bacterium]|nr:AraC family transcriptional regulator [Verrucomicrobiota bacterium]MCF7709076.1 AraC family transcriptional regulator [Verrucomicrobiota bacterium]